MAQIDDLKIAPLNSLAPSEGLQLILDMRARRKYVPVRVPRESSDKRAKKTKILNVESAIAAMSDEQLLELMSKLGDK